MSEADYNNMKTFLGIVADGTSLTQSQASSAFEIIMSGDATPTQIGALLMALRVRGVTVEEITGVVSILRSKMTKITAPDGAIDIVGTGGSGLKTFNVSTAAAYVVAGCGVTVAKHGNKAQSSISGTADAQACLGVNLDADFSVIEKCIREAGIGFLFAMRHHAAMRHVGPSRAEIGTRTVFNLAGPLSNPAGVRRQFTGSYAAQWVEPMAQVLKKLGSEKAWIVHGMDGMDELTTTGTSLVAELKDGEVSCFELSPEDAGLPIAKPEDLKGGDPQYNAAAIRDLLAGGKSAFRDIVLFNASGALIVADKASTLKEGVEMAEHSIDSGAAARILEKLIAITNE